MIVPVYKRSKCVLTHRMCPQEIVRIVMRRRNRETEVSRGYCKHVYLHTRLGLNIKLLTRLSARMRASQSEQLFKVDRARAGFDSPVGNIFLPPPPCSLCARRAHKPVDRKFPYLSEHRDDRFVRNLRLDAIWG